MSDDMRVIIRTEDTMMSGRPSDTIAPADGESITNGMRAHVAGGVHDRDIAGADILIVDDEEANVVMLSRILTRAGFTGARTTTSAVAALGAMEEKRPELLLLDLHMPEVDGFEVLERLRPHEDEPRLPVIILSGDSSIAVRRRALAAGAADFLLKPFDPIEVTLRIANLLEIRKLHLALKQQNAHLEDRVRERTAALERSHQELLERLCRVAAYRDDDTGSHTLRVGHLATRLARVLGLDEETATMLGSAAELHDIGKVGVADHILHKPGRLDDDEMCAMRRHTEIGATALAGSQAPLLQLAEQIARCHHEKWDGSGYPNGLSGEGIPLSARIVAVADVADALSSDRPYRAAWPIERVRDEIRAQSGRHFDPAIADAYLSLGDHTQGAPT